MNEIEVMILDETDDEREIAKMIHYVKLYEEKDEQNEAYY